LFLWYLATQQDDAGDDIHQASVAVHFRILRVAAHFNAGFSMPCAWENCGYAECILLPIEIGDESVDLFHPALRTADSLAMVECMRTAVRALERQVASRARRRLLNVDSHLTNVMGTLMRGEYDNTSDVTFRGDGTTDTEESVTYGLACPCRCREQRDIQVSSNEDAFPYYCSCVSCGHIDDDGRGQCMTRVTGVQVAFLARRRGVSSALAFCGQCVDANCLAFKRAAVIRGREKQRNNSTRKRSFQSNQHCERSRSRDS
jgi:hypothetical protein